MVFRVPRSLYGLALLVGLSLVLSAAGSQDKGKEPDKKAQPLPPEAVKFFETKVRPVLAENCFKCHSGAKKRGGLHLDSLQKMLEGGDIGPAIVPGHPEKSLLIKGIEQKDKEFKMPPDSKLSATQIADLTLWIKMGAPWPGAETVEIKRPAEFQLTEKDKSHWAYQPIKRPALPNVKNAGWVANPIDAFILAKLEAKGLTPNAPASKHELVRRAFYDVTGLAPTPKEIEDFVNDASPKAYEDLVDRLLASERYGEKWARHWLDLVRYAETNSYERDNPKPHVWRYRDYVIRAFNSDKPYDRFLREQLAGDEMPNRDNDAIIATGFYRLGLWDDEPADPLLAKYDGLDDIVATTSQAILGLTVDCARCHDHKIDPIPQKDYYRLMAFFHNISYYRNGGAGDEVALAAGPDVIPGVAGTGKGKGKGKQGTKQADVQAAITAIEKEFRTAIEKDRKTTLLGNDLANLTYRIYRDSWMKLPEFGVLKHEDEGKLPKNLFDISPRMRDEAFGFVFEGTLNVPEKGKYTFYLDSDDGSRLTIAGKTVLEYDGIHGVGTGKSVTVELPEGRLPIKLEYFQNLHGFGLAVAWSGPNFGRRSLSVPMGAPGNVGDFNRLIASEGPTVLGKEKYQQYVSLKKELAALNLQAPTTAKALAVTETSTKAPQTFVLVRGNPAVKGPEVEPAIPLVLGGKTAKIANLPAGVKSTGRRTALAELLVDRDNPLTSRVMVNRIWQHHFGRGIVRSPNNWGVQGDRPTHPELLDWLASEFMDNGWSMKKLHKTILTSNTYRMSSKTNAEALKVDQQNDLFWRYDMRRLSAEEIRDSILQVTGSLNVKMYGPGVYPEIPPEVLAGQSVPGRGWGKSPIEEQNRRSVYIHVKRSLLYPLLESFDLAETDRSSPVRFVTIQPTQALAMINGSFLNKQSQLLSDRLKREAGDDVQKQVRLGLYLATCRPPTDDAVRRGVGLIEAFQREDGASPELARRYFCLMVLNLNEFMYLD